MAGREMTVTIPERLYRDIQARRPAGVGEFVQQAVAEKLDMDSHAQEMHERAVQALRDHLDHYEDIYGYTSAEVYAAWQANLARDLDIWEDDLSLWVYEYEMLLKSDTMLYEIETGEGMP